MEIEQRCPHCNHLNVFDQDELLKKAAIYKPLKSAINNIPQLVIKKCQSCASKIKIKL